MTQRTEKDSLGEFDVPADALYGINTSRSVGNFPISGQKAPPRQVAAIAMIKQACAMANMELGLLDRNKGTAIVNAAAKVADGGYSEEFPVDIFASGSGTSHNMNVNEVIANLAEEALGGRRGEKKLVHPNDHVNMGQSTNDVFPSSIRVAAVPCVDQLVSRTRGFVKTLNRKSRQFDMIIKSGRTHLQDAVPVRMGQVFGAWAYSISKGEERLRAAMPRFMELAVGGNAVGTGINNHHRFRKMVIKHLNAITKRKGVSAYKVAGHDIEAVHGTNDMAALSAAVSSLAVDVQRICNDLRLMASGPMTGFNEVNLPPVEPGSSIMPGKVNPSICEAVNMVCLKVFGNHQTIFMAAQSAQLELNVTMPVTGYALLESLTILANGIMVLDEKCVAGVTVNKEVCERYALQSPSLATFLNPYIGYVRASEVAKKAVREGKTVPEVVLEEGLLTKEELAKVFDPKKLTSPGP
ncbi:MAG: aspartate ammonia-lyase [Nitrospinota bacterium]|nr:aspartate ammonia-lyase [Nitrospinota bacterium]